MDIRIYFQVFIYFLIAQINFGQEVYSFRSDYGYLESHGQVLIELDSVYASYNRVWVDSLDPYLKVMFTKIDKKTGLYSDKMIFNEPESYTTFVKNNFVHKTDSSLIYIGVNAEKNHCIKMYEYFLFNDSLSSKSILCDTQYIFGYLSDVNYFNNSLIICGQVIDRLNPKNGLSTLIVVDDSLKANRKYFSNNSLYNASANSILELDDGYLIVTLLQHPNQEGNIKLLFTDTNFSVTDSFTFNKNLKLIPGSRALLIDSFTLVVSCSKYFENNSLYPYTFFNPALLYFDLKTRQIIKIQDFDDKDLHTWDGAFKNLIMAHDENILYAGDNTYYVQEKDQLITDVVIGKLDKKGNQIWRKFYNILKPEINDATYFHWINDIEATSDGNYICYAEISGFINESNRLVKEAWIFKIDEEGNFVNAGGPSAVAWENEVSLPVTVYPNPTTDHLFINQGEIENLTYEVYDEWGKVIFKIKSSYSERSYMLDVSSFATGNYFLKIMQNGHVKGSLKFQKL